MIWLSNIFIISGNADDQNIPIIIIIISYYFQLIDISVKICLQNILNKIMKVYEILIKVVEKYNDIKLISY